MLLRQWPSMRSLEYNGKKDVAAALMLFHDAVLMALSTPCLRQLSMSINHYSIWYPKCESHTSETSLIRKPAKLAAKNHSILLRVL